VALTAVWAQWGVLNPMLLRNASAPVPASILDPEALVLASLCLWDSERRLADVLAWWAARGSGLMSTRRIKSLRPGFPAERTPRLGQFAAWAHEAGDTRWKADVTEPVPVRAGKGPKELRLEGPATLLLRLRAGFGVSAKPDVLAFVVAMDGVALPSKEIARAVSYADTNVRQAARDLLAGGFLEQANTFPIAYRSPIGFAHGLVRLLSRHGDDEDLPHWIHWPAVYAFLISVAGWEGTNGAPDPYLLSTQARDLYEEHGWIFERAGLRVPDPARYRGDEYLPAFSDTLDILSDWISAQL
jgi:hypothetical protein